MHMAGASSSIETELLNGLLALKRGDFGYRMRSDLVDLEGKIADTFNEVIEMNQRLSSDKLISIGATYKTGVYFAEFMQGKQRKIVKLIKL